MKFRIKEHSFIAYCAAKFMKAPQMAIVIGSTIHLHNTSAAAFLQNQRWLNHEMVHIDQFRRYGYWRFIFLYLIEYFKVGYENNKYEKEARAGEAGGI